MPKRAAILCCLLVGVVTSHLNKAERLHKLWERSGKFEGDMKIAEGDAFSPRNVQIKGWWPGGIVPYAFDPLLSGPEIWVILLAMGTIESVVPKNGTCRLQFVPFDGQPNYIYFTNAEPSCWSWFGVVGGRQELNLGYGCYQIHTVVHELLHALGFSHQHSSPTRDQFIDIIWENVKEDEHHNFEAFSHHEFTNFGLPYDYHSIMHYSPYALAKLDANGSYVGPTIIAKDPKIKITDNTELSPIDIQKLHIMYCNHRNPYFSNFYHDSNRGEKLNSTQNV